MIHVKSEGYNLTWVNCEMASFIHMKESRNFFVNPHAHGIIVQVPTLLAQGFGSGPVPCLPSPPTLLHR